MPQNQEEQYPYSNFRLRLEGNILLVQPHKIVGKGIVPTLMLNTETGKLVQSLQEQRLETDYMFFLGIAGIVRLSTGVVVAAITGAERVAQVKGATIYRILEVTYFGEPQGGFKVVNDVYLADVFRSAFDPKIFGQGLFFSYGCDLTLNQQKLHDVLASVDFSNKFAYTPDDRFFWNKAMIKPIIEANCQGFVLPIVCGVVLQSEQWLLESGEGPKKLQITTIARRSRYRAGTRHWRRGADQVGQVANFVETEMMVTINEENDDNEYIASFIQIRGSIPLLWTHWPNIKYKPPLEMADPTQSQGAFDTHMRSLVQVYNEVVSVNLANQKGSEGKLSAAFKEQTDRLFGVLPKIKLISFDFHKELGASKYENLSKLKRQLQKYFEDFGMFVKQSNQQSNSKQSGVFRTNCVDCLDRTNVVQAMLGRHALETIMKSQGIMNPGGSLQDDFPQIEQYMKIMWADHGDQLAIQYAGTGAMKSGFTRTGKRTLDGYADDGYKAIARYYLNNFEDGRKQDAIDLVTGTFAVDSDGSSGFFISQQPSAFFPFWIAVISLWYGVYLIQNGRFMLGMAFVLGEFGIFYFIYSQGKMFVNKPILRVDQIKQW